MIKELTIERISLPTNWEIKKMSELFDVKSSKRVHKADWKEDGVPFYRAREVVKLAENDFVDNALFISEKLYQEFIKEKGAPKKGDIIISAVGTLGKCYLVKGSDKFYFKDASVLWFENISNVNTQYIDYAFKSDLIMKQVMNKSMGATVGTLTISRAKIIEIPLPPLPEQKQIVAILDKAFAAIDTAKANAEQNLQNAKELFESYLQNVFENKGDDWEESTLGEVCSLITDGKHGNCKNEENSGFYFLSAKNIRNNTLLFEGGRQITKKDFLETHQRTDLKPGDICMINTGATIGRISFAPEDKRTYKTTFQKSVAVIKPIASKINNHYCRYLLVADVKKLVKVSSGTAIPNLLLGDLRKHKINLPKSLKEQKKIVKNLDALSAETQKLEALYIQKIADLEEMKKSVLQKAFSGQLNTPIL